MKKADITLGQFMDEIDDLGFGKKSIRSSTIEDIPEVAREDFLIFMRNQTYSVIGGEAHYNCGDVSRWVSKVHNSAGLSYPVKWKAR